MNRTTQGVALTTFTAAAVAMAAGVAAAAPENGVPADAQQSQSVTADVAPGVRYSDNLATGATLLATPFGTVTMRAGQFDVRDATGHTVAGTPIENTGIPAVTPRAAAFAPAPRPELATPAAASVQPAADPMSDLNQAVEAANPHMGAALAVGTAVGSVVGALIGCPFGIATGGTLLSLASVGTLTVPALAATCLVGAVAVGGFGAVVGGVGLAIPVGIAAGVEKYNQLQAQHAAAAAHPPAAPAS